MEPNQPTQTDKNAGCLKAILFFTFFPFVISYFLFTKLRAPLAVRITTVLLLWIVLIAALASSSKNPTDSASKSDTNTAQTTSTTPTPTVGITMEQKQADFTNLFLKYNALSEQILNIQKKILDVANLTSNREDLYLALDSLSNQQAKLSEVSFDLDVPKSLKEYKDLSSAVAYLGLASGKFKNAIDDFKKYVNTNNLEALKSAKDRIGFGKDDLNTSLESMKKVAAILSVDISDPKKLTASTGTKELAAGSKVPFELIEEMAMVGNASGSYNRTVVISLNNMNENDLKVLGEEFKEYAKKDQFSFINVFSDKNAATKIRARYTNEDKTLSQADTDLYEKSFVGKYIKSGNVHNFTFCLKGYYLDGCKGEANKKVIEYK